MDPLKPNPTKIATKWALIYFVVSIVITYAFQFLDIDQNSPAKYISYMPFIAFLLLTQKEYKDALGGYLTFGEGFSAGFRYALFSGLLLALFLFVYLAYLSPDMLDKAVASQQDKLAEQGLSAEQIDKANEMTKKYGPLFGAVAAAIGSAIFGAVIALVGAAIFKKERTPFDYDDRVESTTVVDPIV